MAYRTLYTTTSCTIVPIGAPSSNHSILQSKICPMGVCYYSDTRRRGRRKVVRIKRHHKIRLVYVRTYVVWRSRVLATSV